MSDRFDRMASAAANYPALLRDEFGELISYIKKNFKDIEPQPGFKFGRILVREFEVYHDNSVYCFSLQYRTNGQTGCAFDFGRDYSTGRYCYKEYGKRYRFFSRKQDVEQMVVQHLKARDFI